MDLGALVPLFLLLGFVWLVAAALRAVSQKKPSAGKRAHKYRKGQPLLTKAERSFYGVLLQALQGEDVTVFAKVRVADVLAPLKGLSRGERQGALNAITSKHFDFVVCKSTDCSVQLCIELDDESHQRKDRQRRDAFLDEACASSELPLLHFRAARGYVVGEVREKLAEVLRLAPSVDAAEPLRAAQREPLTEESAPSQRDAVTASNAKNGSLGEAPACPKCGANMRLMQSEAGKLAGQTYWGCSTYPVCRGASRIEAVASGISGGH